LHHFVIPLAPPAKPNIADKPILFQKCIKNPKLLTFLGFK